MPHLSTEHLAHGARLGLWQITETAAELRAQLGHPELYADTVARLRPGSRREREVLAVRCLLRAVEGEEQRVVYDAEHRPGIGMRTAEAGEAADGREPQAVDGSPFVSISHTEGYAAVLLADRPVGIDIERMGPRVARVTSHFLQADEAKRLTSPRELHLAWSAKETAFKLLGSAYYDLRRLTRVASVRYDAGSAEAAGEEPTCGELTLEVTGRPALAVRFRTCADYVLTWTLGAAAGA